ncbi:MAG: apolipoprotein N-acyltransferase [Mobilicoccus sp.]|nr:apolipoprotein N-acyltransferase [Mobilicoccus sp.]
MLLRLLLATLGGVALWASFPSLAVWASAPVGIALLVAATREVRAAAGFLLGFVGGLVWFVPYVSWTGLHAGTLPWLALAVLQALFVGLFGLLVALSGRTALIPLVPPLLWVAAEWARASVPFGGFPWGRIAYSQADSPLLHLASLGGPALMGLAVALVGCLLLWTWDALRARGSAWVVGARVLVTCLVLVTPQLIPLATEGPTARLMAIQGNAPQTGFDFNAQRRQILDNHGTVSQEAAEEIKAGRRPAPDLVVWPENASDIDPFDNPDAGRVIDEATTALDRPVLVGAVLGGARDELTNTAILWEPGVGATDQRYDKRELVPFGEYMPYRSFFRAITRQVDLLERDFVPGHEAGLIDIGPIRAGLGICFEVAIDHVLRDVVDDGANLLVIQTNNAMFDFSGQAAQQLDISRVRAVEFGRSVVHSSNVGISALITPDGEAHQRTELFTPAIIEGELPLRTEQTVASRVGIASDVVPTVLGALVVGGVLLGSARRRV